MRRSRGFTLIEVLVVVAIIGILSALIYSGFSTVRQSARDQQRKTDLKEMQLAIERYKAQEGRYPESCRGADIWSGVVNEWFMCAGGSEEYILGLVPDYIDKLPIDARASTYDETSSQGYLYKVNSDGSEYKLMAHWTVEKDTIGAYTEEFARCPRQTGACTGVTPPTGIYAVYSPGFAGE